jgi:hypothetical protein
MKRAIPASQGSVARIAGEGTVSGDAARHGGADKKNAAHTAIAKRTARDE